MITKKVLIGFPLYREGDAETSKKESRAALFFVSVLLCREGQQGDVARALDGERHLALMFRAVARNAAGQDLSALRDEAAELARVLIVDVIYLVHAERADFLAGTTASVTSDHGSFLL